MDQYDDIQNDFLEKLANVGVMFESKRDVSELDDRDFAIIVIGGKRPKRKFPVCDKETTLMSLLYFLKNISSMPKTYIKTAGAKLKEACVKYDIDAPLEQFPTGVENNKVKEATKKVEAKHWGLPKKKKFPLETKEQVERALNFYPQQKNKLSKEEKQELARNIHKRAKDFGIKKEKKASLNHHLTRDMNFRTRNLEDDQKKPFIKLATMLQNEEIDPEVGKGVLDRLDGEYGLSRTLSSEDTIYGQGGELEKDAFVQQFVPTKEKVASVEDDMQYVIANNKGDLEAKLLEVFDESIVKDLINDPQTIYTSLPDPHKDLIKNVVREVMSGA